VLPLPASVLLLPLVGAARGRRWMPGRGVDAAESIVRKRPLRRGVEGVICAEWVP
jgi:hypothetical protein